MTDLVRIAQLRQNHANTEFAGGFAEPAPLLKDFVGTGVDEDGNMVHILADPLPPPTGEYHVHSDNGYLTGRQGYDVRLEKQTKKEVRAVATSPEKLIIGTGGVVHHVDHAQINSRLRRIAAEGQYDHQDTPARTSHPEAPAFFTGHQNSVKYEHITRPVPATMRNNERDDERLMGQAAAGHDSRGAIHGKIRVAPVSKRDDRRGSLPPGEASAVTRAALPGTSRIRTEGTSSMAARPGAANGQIQCSTTTPFIRIAQTASLPMPMMSSSAADVRAGASRPSLRASRRNLLTPSDLRSGGGAIPNLRRIPVPMLALPPEHKRSGRVVETNNPGPSSTMVPGRVQSFGTQAQTYGTRIGASTVGAQRAGLLPSITHTESTQKAHVRPSDSTINISTLQPDIFVPPEELRVHGVRSESGPTSALQTGQVSLSKDNAEFQTIMNASALAQKNHRPTVSHDRRPVFSGTQIVHIPGEFNVQKNTS